MSSKRKRKEDPHATGLCSTCEAMTSTVQGLRSLTSRAGYQHLNKKWIAKSSKRGCLLCTILRSYRGHADSDGHTRVFMELESVIIEDKESNIEHPLRGSRVKRLLVNSPPGQTIFGHELRAFTASNDLAARFLDVLPISIQVMSSTIVRRIKDRLAKCQKEHKYCPLVNTPMLPKRVLDVGVDHLNPSVSVYLSEPNEQALYVALSYCWGGPQDITTTSATLQQYTKSLPRELPQTIQDAITVTRSLGFRYLWVDALCIIQDDNSDKFAEISHMGMIYKSAALTIAAASASSVKDGFLQDRPPLLMSQLPFYMADDKNGNIWLRNPSQVHTMEPLDFRAWTLQESLLSPRILYYATKDLIWKCQTEQFVAVQGTHNPYFKVSTGRLPHDIFEVLQTSDAVSQSRTWKKIVVNYSGRKLSVPEDRLPALAGLAGELHNIWMDEYVAGMWKSCLVKHLGWWRSSEQNKEPLTTHKFPTWSWASHDGQVMISEVHREEAKLLDVTVTLIDEKFPLGSVRCGTVVLRAPVLSGDVEMDLGSWIMDYEPHGLNMVGADTKFLLLGYSVQKIPIGLILSPLGEETFVRTGLVIGWHLKGSEPWSSNWVKREVIRIN